jgi:ribosomal protein L40E
MLGAIAFVGIRVATRGRGRAAVKFCPACFETIPLEATKCRACGTDL